MKKFYILLTISLLFPYLGFSQDDDCIVSAGFELTPAPVDDPNTGFTTYASETTVQICYTVEQYNTPGTQNWMHGIVPSFGPGWNISTLQPVGQPEAQTNFGEWIWVEDGVTAGITGEFFPLAGWWYDSTQGTVPSGTPLDGDPSNNWGDGNNGPWEFCWEITTQSCPPQIDGANLIIEILNFADSETGSWNNTAALNQCIDDPSYFIQGIALDCPTCDETEITTINPTCETINTTGGVAVINPGGVGPWDYEWFSFDTGETIQENSNVAFPGVVTLSGLDPGGYGLYVQDLGSSNSVTDCFEEFQILPPESILVEFAIDSATCLESSDGSIIISSIMNENCIDEAAIDLNVSCPSTPNEVCGCDFVTYFNSCQAENWYGITSYENGECPNENLDYSISWSSNNAINGTDTLITDLVSGDYTVFIECIDNTSPIFGCSFESVVTVPSPDPWNISGSFADDYNGFQVSCSGENDANLDVIVVSGGNGGNTYSWTGPNNFVSNNMNIDNLGAGAYELTVTDQYGCQSEPIEFIASEPDALAANAFTSDYNGFNISCNGGSDGVINLEVSGGVEPYTFEWSNGSTEQNLTNASAGTYSVTILCANLCELVLDNLVLNEPDAIEVASFSEQAVTCFDFADGAIGITVAGGVGAYNYEWSNGSDDEDLINIPTGSYTVEITDENNCLHQETFNVSTPSPIIILESIDNISCNGENDGSINISVSGGTPFSSTANTYDYTWSNGLTSQNLNNLSPGSYELTVTDSQGCIEIATYVVEEPDVLVINEVEIIDVDCFGDNTGSAIPSVSGGTGNYTYTWSNGDNTEDLQNVSEGTYSLTVEDVNGCVDVFLGIVINQPSSSVNLTAVVTDVVCYGDSDGFIIPSASGGTPPYNISNLFNLSAGTYPITVVDANGCQEVVDFVVDQPNELITGIEDNNSDGVLDGGDNNITNVQCYGANDGFISANPSGGTGNYTYLWSNGSTDSFIEDLSPGTYWLSIEDAAGCQVFQNNLVINEPSSADLEIIALDPIVCLNDFDVTVLSSSGFSVSGSWSANDSNISFTDNSNINTTVEVADFGSYEIIFIDDTCLEEVSFYFEMLPIAPVTLADPYAHYCDNDVPTLLQAESEDNNGYWVLVSPSAQELIDNNTLVQIDNENALSTIVTIEELNPSSSVECCYGEYEFEFYSCGAVDVVTVYYGKRAPQIGTSTHQECVLDGQIYIDNPISFSDALLNPGNWQPIGSNAGNVDILYETPHEVGVSVSEYGMYTLQYENCDTTFIQSIGFSCPLTLPNAFTPNGDGNNDVFSSTQLIEGIHEQVNFTVYNRFGTIVHAQSDWSPVNNGVLWDGTTNTFSDRDLSDGAYFYTLELYNRASNRKEMYNGYVHVFGADNE